MRPFSFALTLGAVAALRVAPLRMSATATEAAAKAKWLAKTAKPTFTGKVVATNAIAPPAPQAAAYAYEDRVLGRTHGGPTAYERSMLHPSTHWGVVATAGTRDAAPSYHKNQTIIDYIKYYNEIESNFYNMEMIINSCLSKKIYNLNQN